MVQVLIRNLTSNDIKFCNPGDVITIEGRAIDGIVEICVADTDAIASIKFYVYTYAMIESFSH